MLRAGEEAALRVVYTPQQQAEGPRRHTLLVDTVLGLAARTSRRGKGSNSVAEVRSPKGGELHEDGSAISVEVVSSKNA